MTAGNTCDDRAVVVQDLLDCADSLDMEPTLDVVLKPLP